MFYKYIYNISNKKTNIPKYFTAVLNYSSREQIQTNVQVDKSMKAEYSHMSNYLNNVC